MTPISVLTLVKNRASHLSRLVEGLRRSSTPPAELVIIDMSDEPVEIDMADGLFPIRIDRFPTDQLPLAAARNRAAAIARSPNLLFLDVDCIPTSELVPAMATTVTQDDALVCAEVRYLGPGDAGPGWTEAALLAAGVPHPVRDFPAVGTRVERNPGLFWSLAFGIRADAFAGLGGFDEAFVGYGAEDTDFGFRATEAGLPLLFLGGAIACHQHHASCDPPLDHFDDIIRNARRFRMKWGRWAMEGWLDRFAAMRLISIDDDDLTILRPPSPAEIAAARSAGG